MCVCVCVCVCVCTRAYYLFRLTVHMLVGRLTSQLQLPQLQRDLQWHPGHGLQHGYCGNLWDGKSPWRSEWALFTKKGKTKTSCRLQRWSLNLNRVLWWVVNGGLLVHLLAVFGCQIVGYSSGLDSCRQSHAFPWQYCMRLCLSQAGVFTCIHKHYSVEAWKEFAAENKGILQVFLYIISVNEQKKKAPLVCCCCKMSDSRSLNWI